jgi:hypothetical protein
MKKGRQLFKLYMGCFCYHVTLQTRWQNKVWNFYFEYLNVCREHLASHLSEDADNYIDKDFSLKLSTIVVLKNSISTQNGKFLLWEMPIGYLFLIEISDKLISVFPLWLYSPIQALITSMKFSISLQLLDLGQLVGLLWRMISSSQGLYLYTNTEKHTTQTLNIHALSGIQTHGPGVRASEDNSCRRPLGYRDRLASERAKTVHALYRAATVTG